MKGMKYMKVLLTGGAGYIGSHTCIELLSSGYDVVIADDFSNSSMAVINRIEKISNKKVVLYNIDVADIVALDELFNNENIDAVIHFAGFKAVGESCEKPTMYYRNNIDTTLSLLECMEKYNVKRFVFSSSATVYGNADRVEYVEDMPTNAVNPYGRTKMFIEHILNDAANADSELSVVLLRYFNPIGAHQSGLIGDNPNGIPNNLMPYITQVAVGKREKLSVFGDDYPTPDGTGVRDYIHVCDLAKGHVAALRYSEKNTGCEAFNLGTGVGYSVLDIVKAFEKVNNVKIPYVVTERRDGDLPEYYANPAKALNVLGWKTEKTLEDMCADSWRWQMKNPNGYTEE